MISRKNIHPWEGVVPTGAIGMLVLIPDEALHKGMLSMHQNGVILDFGLKTI